MNKVRILIVSAFILIFNFSVAAETERRFLGGIEAGMSIDALALSNVIDSREVLPLGLTAGIFTKPFAGLVYSLGIAVESNLVNGGWLIKLGGEMPLLLSDWLSVAPGVSLAFGTRSEGYILPSWRYYGLAALELPLDISLSDWLGFRLGVRAALCYKEGHEFFYPPVEPKVIDVKQVYCLTFPLIASIRFKF